jgi:hypothetical protein
VEGIHAALGIRAALGDRAGDPGGHVTRHQLDPFAALLAELIEERLDRLAVPPGRRPHKSSRVVIDDDGQIALTGAVRDISSIPIRSRPASRSTSRLASALTRS